MRVFCDKCVKRIVLVMNFMKFVKKWNLVSESMSPIEEEILCESNKYELSRYLPSNLEINIRWWEVMKTNLNSTNFHTTSNDQRIDNTIINENIFNCPCSHLWPIWSLPRFFQLLIWFNILLEKFDTFNKMEPNQYNQADKWKSKQVNIQNEWEKKSSK